MVDFGWLFLFGMAFTQLSLWFMAKLDTDEKIEGKVRFPFIYGTDKIGLIGICLLVDVLFGLIIALVLECAQLGCL
jgi:hypothetical protein